MILCISQLCCYLAVILNTFPEISMIQFLHLKIKTIILVLQVVVRN